MRRDNDFYETPTWMTRALLKRVHVGGNVGECCSGDEAISNILRTRPEVESLWRNDIDPQRPADSHEDATSWGFWADSNFDWVVTNPPWNLAHKILPLALEYATEGVAMLLRLSFLEPLRSDKNAARTRWIVEHPPHDLIILPRWSFTGDGKVDSVCPAWMVFYKQPQPQRIMVVHPDEMAEESPAQRAVARPEVTTSQPSLLTT